MYVAKNQRDWDDFIPLILFTHRTSISEGIGNSPFLLFVWSRATPAIYDKFLPPAADAFSTSVFDHRKSIVVMVELAENFGSSREYKAFTTGNEGLLRSQCKSTTFGNWTTCLGLHTKNDQGSIKETIV